MGMENGVVRKIWVGSNQYIKFSIILCSSLSFEFLLIIILSSACFSFTEVVTKNDNPHSD